MDAEESTPLLGTSSSPSSLVAYAAQYESSSFSSSPLLASALAPPPSDAPPPLPTTKDDEEEDNNSDDNPSWVNHKRNNTSTSIETNNSTIGDNNTSESQLSLTQSNNKKQRRNTTSKNKKRSGDTTASSSNNSSSTSTSNNNKRSSSQRSKDDKSSKKKKRQQSQSQQQSQQQSQDKGPQKTIPHFLFNLVRYLAIFTSLAMLFLQFLPIINSLDKQPDNNNITGLQYFVRIYLILFCISFLLLESRIPLFTRFLTLFLPVQQYNNWILRGFMYTFIGIIGMEQDVAMKVEDIAANTGTAGTTTILGPDYGNLFVSLLVAITTWIMVGVGIVYMIMGMMCLQQWYERLEKEYQEKVEEWKRRRKRERDVKKEKEEYVKYEKDRREGRGEWYDDIESGK